MSHFETLVIRVLMVLSLTACATTQHERIKELKVGMDKSEVLDLLGSPLRSRYNKGTTTWTYVSDDSSRSQVKLEFTGQDLVKISDVHEDEKAKLARAADKNESLEDYQKKIEAARKEKSSGFEEISE